VQETQKIPRNSFSSAAAVEAITFHTSKGTTTRKFNA